MSVDTGKYRQALEAKLEEINARKHSVDSPTDDVAHVHDWHPHKETIEPARSRQAEKKGYYYTKGEAYFTVKVCYGCKEKRRTHLFIKP